MISVKAFLALEDTLRDALADCFLKTNTKALNKWARAVNREDRHDADNAVADIDFNCFDGVLDRVRSVSRSAFIFGQSLTGNAGDPSQPTPEETQAIFQQANQTIRGASEGIEGEILTLLSTLQAVQLEPDSVFEDISKQRVTKAEKIRNFVSFAKTASQNKVLSAAQVSASLHTARLSTYGFYVEARATEITRYRINSVLDVRRCPVCEQMHGKIFEVSTLGPVVSQLVTTDDPQELKELAPFPKQDRESVEQLSKRTNDEIVALRQHLSPFHPLCRCLTIAHRERTPGRFANVVEENPLIDATLAQLRAFKPTATPRDLDRTGRFLRGLTLASHVTQWKKAFRPTDRTSVEIDATIKETKIEFDMRAGETRLQRTYGETPSGTRYVSLDGYELGTVAPSTVKRFQRDAMAQHIAMGLDEIRAVTGTGLGLHAALSFGFIPATKAGFAALKSEIRDRIQSLDLPDADKLVLAAFVRSLEDFRDIWAIADMTRKVGGKTIGERLLSGRILKVRLDLSDSQAVNRFKGFFPDG